MGRIIERGMEEGMPDDSEAGPGIVSETTTRINPRFATSPPGPDSAWSRFKASWTEREREDDIGAWDRQRAGEFIELTAGMVSSFFGDAEAAATKAMTSFAFRMLEAGLERVDYSASVRGSRFGVEREEFSGSMALADAGEPSRLDEPASATRSAVMSEDDRPPIGEKLFPVWEDREAALALWDQLRAAFGDEPGSQSAQDAALLLVHFEHVSLRNAETMRTALGGLHTSRDDGTSTETGRDAFATTRRVAIGRQAAPSTRTRM